MSLLNKIIQAIENRKLMEFNYDGNFRIVEPHTVGVSKTGKEMLSAFQTGGDSNRGNVPCWGQFSVSKIEKLQVLDDSFSGTRSGYTRGDSRMNEIYAEL
jgi:predicted DNA-binding transcriptional regulator YafY